MRHIFIPEAGWDSESIVTGHIKLRGPQALAGSRQTLADYPFGGYPFTNIFWSSSPEAFDSPVIGLAGSYKQLEESWDEWMWKFGQLLSHLDAVAARVSLTCLLGEYDWKFSPKALWETLRDVVSESMIGQLWGITEAPEPGFSLDPDWRAYCTAWAPLAPRWV